MIQIPLFQVDAFTDKPFKGNPAAVCLLRDPLDAETMQAIAAENNLAETAFVLSRDDGFDLRWFTPTVEIALCGHATLATAHVLWQEGWLPKGEVARFYTMSGVLTAAQEGDWICLDFPASENVPAELPSALTSALGVNSLNVVFSKDRYLVELARPEEVYEMAPDFSVLRKYDMVVVTSRDAEASPYDFVSRTFASAHGIDEDPVTGSSHCSLVPYYSEKLGKTEMVAYQASKRGGELRLRYQDGRVLISGQALTVVSGNMILP
ncbi:PhzF family phenazine biosynthesis protein [Arcticibacter sp. MXS-1]|uniref:PhzF family phenazine biosynthesis protein n=1 Tax=Arcticibacter sp. MXS-1 TaxID=3341726 RepID=UPI0035A8933E